MEKVKQNLKASIPIQSQMTYNELIDYLDRNWTFNFNDFSRIHLLMEALGHPNKKLNSIVVSGSNGKSLTVDFTSKILMEEGLKTAVFYSPHILRYNERFAINGIQISDKDFTEIGNEVLSTSKLINISINSLEILTAIAFKYFVNSEVDVALFESGALNISGVCRPKITAVTKLIEKDAIEKELKLIDSNTYFISADPSKLNLQLMSNIVKKKNAKWVMPVRKVAPLSYPLEQLYGRFAALAERIALLYVENFYSKKDNLFSETLLTKPKKNRGRPTIEASLKLKQNPVKTLVQFWKEYDNFMPSRFQLLSKEKPSVLLDNSGNIDGLKNLLLGVRLLHYKNAFKGLILIISCYKNRMDKEGFVKLMRYFFKKTMGQLIICPLKKNISNQINDESWDVEEIADKLQEFKIKVKVCHNFTSAMTLAKKLVDGRDGLLVITGSQEIISNYWDSKEIKKIK